MTPREGLEERRPCTGLAGEASVALTTDRAARETATVLLDCERVFPGAGTRLKVAAGRMHIRPCCPDQSLEKKPYLQMRKGEAEARSMISLEVLQPLFSVSCYVISPIQPLPALLLLVFLVDSLIHISRTTKSSRAQRESLPLFRFLLQAPVNRVQLRDLRHFRFRHPSTTGGSVGACEW